MAMREFKEIFKYTTKEMRKEVWELIKNKPIGKIIGK